eukprot:COSAG05_NODE_677_length_7987_cov_37.034483_6_plen_65_part_00
MHDLMLSDYTFLLRSHIRAQSPDHPSLTWRSSPALTWTAERIQMRRQALKAEAKGLVEEETFLE